MIAWTLTNTRYVIKWWCLLTISCFSSATADRWCRWALHKLANTANHAASEQTSLHNSRSHQLAPREPPQNKYITHSVFATCQVSSAALSWGEDRGAGGEGRKEEKNNRTKKLDYDRRGGGGGRKNRKIKKGRQQRKSFMSGIKKIFRLIWKSHVSFIVML